MAGIAALLLGKVKKAEPEKDDDAETEDMPEAHESGVAEDYAREAYKALKSDDEDGFVEALMGLHGCSGEE